MMSEKEFKDNFEIKIPSFMMERHADTKIQIGNILVDKSKANWKIVDTINNLVNQLLHSNEEPDKITIDYTIQQKNNRGSKVKTKGIYVVNKGDNL